MSLDWTKEMTSQRKVVAAYEKRKMSQFKTREAMDFDPLPKVLYNQKEVTERRYRDPLPPDIVV